jgi:hypothetical protein
MIETRRFYDMGRSAAATIISAVAHRAEKLNINAAGRTQRVIATG